MVNQAHCREQLAQLSDYIDGALPEDLCLELEAHLKDCQNCTIVFNTLEKTIELYQQINGEIALPGDVRKRLFATLSVKDPRCDDE